jgi:hypothetical protein
MKYTPNYVLSEGVRRLGTLVPTTTKEANYGHKPITIVVAAIVVKACFLDAKCLTQILPSTNSYLPNTNPSIGRHGSKSFFENEYGCYLPGRSRLMIWAARSDHNLHIKAPYCGGRDRILQLKSIWIKLIFFSIRNI